jgi:hypothetical protein
VAHNYHHAKKRRVVIVAPTSSLKNSQRPYKLIPCDFENAAFDYMNGNQGVDSKAQYVKIVQDFLKKGINDKYDVTIMQILHGWPIPECPNWRIWNKVASEVFLESIASIYERLLKPS